MYTPVIPMAQLQDGDVVPVRIDQVDVLVIMTEGQYFAIAAHCTHARQSLVSGKLRGFEISCPLHGARFDLRDGQATKGPAVTAIQRFPVLVDSGKVCVDVSS